MTMRKNIDRKSGRTSAVLATALLLGSAMAVGAQEAQLASADARWTPWVGCWQASSRDALSLELAPNKAAPVVCIIPAPGNATVDLVTINGTTAQTPERVDANGTRRAVDREGCKGWETAAFSPDAKRIYLHSEHQCTGNRTRTSTGIMSLTPNGEWLDVQGVKVGAHNGVRVVHYGRVAAPPALGADLRAKLEGQKLAMTTAVLAATDSVRIADVIEASKQADPLVVQTWLAQRGQGFNMDAKRLTQLADAKVPTNVIDVMVALSYPQAFAINLAQADGEMIQTSGRTQVAQEEALRNGPTVFMSWDPLYSGTYGYGYGSRYGMYGWGYGLGYGIPYGTNWYRGPIVVVRPSDNVNVPASETRGRMVRGSGYTRPSGGESSGSGTPRSSTTGGGSSSGGSTSSGGSSSSGGERTAKPRSP
jgi:uncharacterized membrane protein YgcG